MSPKKSTCTAAITLIALLLTLSPRTGIAGSVLISNPLWQFIGPKPIQGGQANFTGVPFGPAFPVTGRVTSIAADPDDPGRIFIGTAGGGLWMTTDGGTTFSRITGVLDPNNTSNGTFPQTTVGSVALNSTTNPPTLYLATGEGNLSDSFWGDGIFSSTSLGLSWLQIASSVNVNGSTLPTIQNEGFTKIAVDPVHSPPYVYAAVTYTMGVNRAGLQAVAYTADFALGIWRSIDGGSTFTQYSASQMGGCADLNNQPCTGDDVVIDPSTGYVYAAVHDGYGSGNYAVMRSTGSFTTMRLSIF